MQEKLNFSIFSIKAELIITIVLRSQFSDPHKVANLFALKTVCLRTFVVISFYVLSFPLPA